MLAVLKILVFRDIYIVTMPGLYFQAVHRESRQKRENKQEKHYP